MRVPATSPGDDQSGQLEFCFYITVLSSPKQKDSSSKLVPVLQHSLLLIVKYLLGERGKGLGKILRTQVAHGEVAL